MRRLVVLLLFVLVTFVPGLLDARRHVAKGFTDPDGSFRADGEISPDDGDGPASAFSLRLNSDRLTFSASLGGTVDPGSLRVALGWSASWFDDENQVHEGPKGGLADGATGLMIDAARGVVEGGSAALSMARGPARPGRPCGMSTEARANHVIRFRRDGEDYTLRVAVHYTRRGHRIVTVDEGPAP